MIPYRFETKETFGSEFVQGGWSVDAGQVGIYNEHRKKRRTLKFEALLVSIDVFIQNHLQNSHTHYWGTWKILFPGFDLVFNNSISQGRLHHRGRHTEDEQWKRKILSCFLSLIFFFFLFSSHHECFLHNMKICNNKTWSFW